MRGSCSNDVNIRKKTTWATSFFGLHTGWKPYRGNWLISELGSAKPRLLRIAIDNGALLNFLETSLQGPHRHEATCRMHTRNNSKR